MKSLHVLSAVLIIVGGLNWGLVALAEFDLVAAIAGVGFGQTNILSRFVYALVGLAAVFEGIALVGALRRGKAHPAAAA